MFGNIVTPVFCYRKNEFPIFPEIALAIGVLNPQIQIAIAIGVLISNRGEGDKPLWRIGRGTRVPLQGAVHVVPLLGAIVGGRVTTNFQGVDVVPLLGAILVCYGWRGGGVTTNTARRTRRFLEPYPSVYILLSSSAVSAAQLTLCTKAF